MGSTRIWRWLLFVVFFLVFLLFTGFFILRDNISCMGVPIVSKSVYGRYTNYVYQNLNGRILFNGEPVAIDVESSTIYLPQQLSEETSYNELPGKLQIDRLGYRLYFKDTPVFDSLHSCASQEAAPELIVVTGPDSYMSYSVVITQLPVIALDGELVGKNEEGRDMYSGSFRLWDANDPDIDGYYTASSLVDWNLRGQTSSLLAKKSWKLSLVDAKGESKGLSMLGLGNDDDWILHPMSVDDTRIREKFAMDLWNEIAAESDWNMDMSNAEYVELVLNGHYWGLYLLQRRVDKKYLELDDRDILLKGLQNDKTYGPEDMYEIIYSPMDFTSTMDLMDGYWDYTDCSVSAPENFVDVNLFLLLLSAADNYATKNMYYCLQWEDGKYSLSLIPWDMDLSFGLAYIDHSFRYNYDHCIYLFVYRPEYDSIKSRYPNLDSLIAQRWAQLREKQFSEDYLVSLARDLDKQLEISGALDRDRQRWELRYDGVDTVDAICHFIHERLAFLDQKFGYCP